MVKAPKDPIKKENGFYVYKDLNIEGSLRPDGKKMNEIYLDLGRVKDSVKIVGGIEDQRILDCFDCAKDFRNAVVALGVSIEAEEENLPMLFRMVMYGEKDMYHGGTHVTKELRTGGMEELIRFDEIEWSEDDKCLGQFQVEFPEMLSIASITVKMYVKDGYDVPQQEEDVSVDVTSSYYKEMIGRSLITAGNNERMKRAIQKAKNKEDVTIAFIGGSITQGAGAVPIATQCYAYKTYQGFVERFGFDGGGNIHYVKAGIGGTSSELGVVRYEKDVCQFGKIEPDVVIMEYAVNDEGDETKGDCYESLMRMIWNSPSQPALILMFSVFSNDWNLQERFIPIGQAYKVPMISVKDAVVPQFSHNIAENRIVSKRQYFYDMFHPTNIGHTIMADCICHYFDVADKSEFLPDISNPPVVRNSDFERVTYVDRALKKDEVNITEGSFRLQDTELHGVELNMDATMTPMFPNNWMCDGSVENSEPFVCKLRCKVLFMVFKDSGAFEFGKAVIKVDGKETMVYDPHEVGWTHCNSVLIIREQEVKEHVVEISLEKDSQDKRFTILALGYVGE